MILSIKVQVKIVPELNRTRNKYMTEEIPLSIQISPQQLNSFCKKIISRSRNTANVHEALMVLEAFISAFSSDSQGTDIYKNIQATLRSHSEKTRNQLILEKTQQLKQGLVTQNIVLLTDVFVSLSRNGFYQVLATATQQIDSTQIDFFGNWVISWANEAKQKAELASGYPDALDFKKANIDIEQYQTMTDIAYFFNNIQKK